MRKIFSALFFILLFALTLSAQTATPTATPKPAKPDEEVVKISTNLIQIDVTVTDRNGKIVTDLKPEDFEIFENKEKQTITNFSFVSAAPENPPLTSTPKNNAKNAIPIPVAPPTPPIRPEQIRRTIALVVDDLALSFENAYYVQRALKKFVDQQMQDGDFVAIVRTGGGNGALQQFTSDKRLLYAAIERVKWNPVGQKGLTAIDPIEGKKPSSDDSEFNGALKGGLSEDTKRGLRDPDQEAQAFRESVFGTGTIGSLNYIVTGMKDLPGRKSVMLFSEGFTLYRKQGPGIETDFRLLAAIEKLVDSANRASVVVYTMDVRGLETLSLTAADNTSRYSRQEVDNLLSARRESFESTQEGLIYLAEQTGGLAVINNNDLNQGITKMLNDQKGYYLVGYAPDSDTFDPKTRRFNKLTVKVNRPGLKVRYRSGFFGITDENVQPAKQTSAQQITAALRSPFAARGIDLRLNTLFGNDAKTGAYVRSLLHINAKDLKFTDEPNGTHKATFDVLAVSYGGNGAVADQIAKNYTITVGGKNYQEILRDGFVYNFVFPVKNEGAYQFRVVVRDSGSEKVGSANQFIDIPNLKKGQLTLSGMVLENLTTKQYADLQSNSTQPENSPESRTDPQTDTSLRRFKRGTVLHYGFEIYNAKLDSSQKLQLTKRTRIFRDGKLLFDGEPSPVDLTGQQDWQKISSSGALSLGGEMTPGDYILQVIVTDNLAKEKRKIATQFVQFEIVE